MTKKRLSKLIMSKGFDRNTATYCASYIRKMRHIYRRLLGENELIPYEEVFKKLSVFEELSTQQRK